MDYRVKADVFYLIDNVPFGDRLYSLLQKYVTRKYMIKERDFLFRYDQRVRKHIEFFGQYGNKKLSDSIVYEYGTGWDMLTAIGFGIGGVKKYICIDRKRFIVPEAIRNTFQLYLDSIQKKELKFSNNQKISYYAERVWAALSAFGNRDKSQMVNVLKDGFNIYYKAPLEAVNTKLKDCSVDFCISNLVLEHVPEGEIHKIFMECYRILKKGGVMSMIIDYQDHYSYFDRSISGYNYMKFSDKDWKKYNTSLHYQNRLRHCDYREMLLRENFSVVEEIKSTINDDDRRELDGITLDEKFKKYSVDDLLTKWGYFVAVKK